MALLHEFFLFFDNSTHSFRRRAAHSELVQKKNVNFISKRCDALLFMLIMTSNRNEIVIGAFVES